MLYYYSNKTIFLYIILQPVPFWMYHLISHLNDLEFKFRLLELVPIKISFYEKCPNFI